MLPGCLEPCYDAAARGRVSTVHTLEASRRFTPPRPSRRTGDRVSVLVVEDDASVLATVSQWLQSVKMTPLTADSTAEALRLVSATRVDVALLDWRLKGHDDGLALGCALAREHGIPFVLFSGYLTTDVTVQALRLGAADVVDKPIRPGRLLAAIEFALHRGPSVSAGAGPPPIDPIQPDAGSVSRRWAAMVLQACRAPKDPRTESAVARAAGMSVSGYRELCRLCTVGARDSRDLVRFVRAVARAKEDGSTLLSHLTIADLRTRDRLFRRAGVSTECGFITLRSLLLGQQFIATTKPCLHKLSHLLANDPLFFFEFDSVDEHAG